MQFLPNVKDEPRPWLARRVPHNDLDSGVSFRSSFDRTRRDSHGRWLWRLVSLFRGLLHGKYGTRPLDRHPARHPLART